jgi:hypothetical protein
MSHAQSPKPPARRYALWLIIACGCLIAALNFGPRSAMGFFQLPMLAEKGWDRTTFALAMAIQNLLWGLGQPVFGALADRFGTWRVLTLSAVPLRHRPDPDGDGRDADHAASGRRRAGRAGGGRRAPSPSCWPPSRATRRPRSAPSSSASARRRGRPACSSSRPSARG